MDGPQEAYTNTGSSIAMWEVLRHHCFCLTPHFLPLNLLFARTLGCEGQSERILHLLEHRQHQLDGEDGLSALSGLLAVFVSVSPGSEKRH